MVVVVDKVVMAEVVEEETVALDAVANRAPHRSNKRNNLKSNEHPDALWMNLMPPTT